MTFIRSRSEQKNQRHLFLLFSLFAFVLASSCTVKEPIRTEFVLGTVCSVQLFEKGTPEIHNTIFSRLRELELIFSANRDDSLLMKINKAAGSEAVQAPEEIHTVLTEALRISSLTDGAFDPTIGPLVKAWNIGTDYAAVPDESDRLEALKLIDYRKVSISGDAVTLEEPGMRLDLGGIAKGYAADEIVKLLKKYGIQRAIIDLGGNVYAYGKKAKNQKWTIGIRDPEESEGDPVLSIPVENQSVVTSGAYERNFLSNGILYHHILDKKTGFPADTGLISVTIVSENSMMADALSTSVFLLGAEKGLELLNGADNTEGILITKDRKVLITPGLKSLVRVLDERFQPE